MGSVAVKRFKALSLTQAPRSVTNTATSGKTKNLMGAASDGRPITSVFLDCAPAEAAVHEAKYFLREE